ncbi:S1/P1 nuclease [Novosphingopyxis sp.]|uniref:S1/P1 nuclease n=1 Tax=Novosphingopyxis sp. TaxID=2709690 RepID=UPI003B5CABBA
MLRFLTALLAALAFLPPAPALGWGEYGHRTVAAIAVTNVSPHAKSVMRRLFKAAPLLGTPDCALKTIGDASVWPDCIRRDRDRWGYTAPWHYQNVDICQPFALEPNCPNGNCAYAQVERNFKILADKSLPDNVRLEALAFLIHFTGDLHQPLHAGDRHDRGGNDVKSDYGIIPDLNLHWIWDGPLAERAISTPPRLIRRYDPAETAQFVTGTPEDWSREAWEASRDIAYARALDGDPCGPKPESKLVIDEADVAASAETLRLQIVRAGLRLADMLKKAL